MSEKAYRKYDIAGWILFLLSAAIFTILGIQQSNMVSKIAGLLFLLACAVFLIPYIKGDK